MNNRGTAFVIILLGNPHLLEGREGKQDRATDPDGVFSLESSEAIILILMVDGAKAVISFCP